MANQPMGHGVKQRDLVRMTPEEIDAFLAGRRTMTLCTLGHDGMIHAIAMWYGFLEGQIAVETKAKSQKVRNLRRDPRITCVVEDGMYYEELRGVMIAGTAEIIEEPARLWEIGVSVVDRYSGPYHEGMRGAVEALMHKRVGIRVLPRKIVSWDHRKLGLPSTRPAQEAVRE